MNQSKTESPLGDRWWAIALSEEVNATKPVGLHLGDTPVVLWRDAAGIARALEDRCPHRRAPLSLGCVKPNGHLQCGYHGWIFDGESGRVQAIPNAKEQKTFPPIYKAEPFAVREAGGFIWVNANLASTAEIAPQGGGHFHGAARVTLNQRSYLETLLDAPGLLMKIPGVRFSAYVMRDLDWQDGRLVMERNCMWNWPGYSDRFRSDWDLNLRVSLDPATGHAAMDLRDDSLVPILRIELAPTPSRRDVTAVRWRAAFAQGGQGLGKLKLLSGLRGGPLHLFTAIDASALEKLLEGPSTVYRHYLETQASSGQLAQAI